MTEFDFDGLCQRLRANKRVPLSATERELVLEYGLRRGGAEDQSVEWNAQSWVSQLENHNLNARIPAEFAVAVQFLADNLGEPGSAGKHDTAGVRRVSRSDVRAQRENALHLFVAAMAWGYGNRGYGFYRTSKVFAENNPDSIKGLVGALVDAGAQDPERSWRTCEKTHRLSQLGPAFSTKIAHFAAYDTVGQRGPLIADANTAWGIWALSGGEIWDIRSNAKKFADYINLCESLATTATTSGDIEYALFCVGPAIKKAWKRSAGLDSGPKHLLRSPLVDQLHRTPQPSISASQPVESMEGQAICESVPPVRATIRKACSDRGIALVSSDDSRDQFDCDGALLTVDYTASGAIRKAWVNERMGERAINGTSKQRKVLSYIRSGFII